MVPTEGALTENRYMAYITTDKIGLQKFPLTGNPFDSIALFAHPDGVRLISAMKFFFPISSLSNLIYKVANLTCSYDGKYLFTTGGENNNMFMWKINLQFV